MQDVTMGIGGIWDACVTGVDFAMGVSILVVPGSVFTQVGHMTVYSSSKEVGLNWGFTVAFLLIIL